jgi:hypothetical protein
VSFMQYVPGHNDDRVLSVQELKSEHPDSYIDELIYGDDIGQATVDRFISWYGKKYKPWNVDLLMLKSFAYSEKIFQIKLASVESGFGVFNTSEIKKNAFIGEYVGVVSRSKNGRYLFSCALDKDEVMLSIDAEEKGNFTRYINHSAKPNLDVACSVDECGFHVLFFANQDIKAGTELSFNYGSHYWKSDPSLKDETSK